MYCVEEEEEGGRGESGGIETTPWHPTSLSPEPYSAHTADLQYCDLDSTSWAGRYSTSVYGPPNGAHTGIQTCATLKLRPEVRRRA